MISTFLDGTIPAGTTTTKKKKREKKKEKTLTRYNITIVELNKTSI